MNITNNLFILHINIFRLPGQLSVLHRVDSDGDPVQTFPPWNGPFSDLERVMVPEPHVFVQELQDPQGFHVQSSENQYQIMWIKLSPWLGLIVP